MDKVVQIEIVAGIVGLAAIALFMNQPNLAQIVMAGLVGFLGGQAIVPSETVKAA